jgi:hypothetical protein
MRSTSPLTAGFSFYGTTGVLRYTSVDIEVGIAPGYFGVTWFAAGAIRYRKTLMTYRGHSNW